MDRLRCSMIGCENEDSHSMVGGHRRFHVFPTNYNLCMLWAQNSGRPEFFEDFAFSGVHAYSFINSHICSDHFNEGDFIEPKDRLSRLQPTAVPNSNCPLLKVEVKEEYDDTEFSESVDDIPISYSEVINKLEVVKFEPDNSTNFSYSSADDSGNDILGDNPYDDLKIYQESQQGQIREEFFRNYSNAVHSTHGEYSYGTGESEHYFINYSINHRAYETDESRMCRLKRERQRMRIRRSMETEEEANERRVKNAVRAAFRRKNETPEERELRKKKDVLRSQRRRAKETEEEANDRRHNDAVRAAFRRNMESHEQYKRRRKKDNERAAKRRKRETSEERETRQRKDRERASKRRMYKKMADQIVELSTHEKFLQLLIPIKLEPQNGVRRVAMTSLQSVAAECKDPVEEPTFDKLQQVLEFVRGLNNDYRLRHTKSTKEYYLQSSVTDRLNGLKEEPGLNKTPCATNSGDSEKFGEECASGKVKEEGHDMEGIVEFLQPEVVWS